VFARRSTRRQMFRSASVATAAIAAAGTLSACAGQAAAGGTASKSSAFPGPTAGDIIINFAPNWQGASWNATALELNQQFIDQNYNAKNPGVYVKVAAPVQGGAQGQIAASIAGSGFLDVFQDCCNDLAVLEASGFLTPLDSYLQQDNIDTSIWNKAHLGVLTYGGHLMALPAYDGPVAVYYRQDLLDKMGLEYPGATWTYKEAQSIWQQSTKTVNIGGKTTHQYGVQLYNTGYYEQLPWWLQGWGASMMNAAGTQCTADSTKGADCLTFLQTLSTSGVAQGRSGISYLGNGQCVFKEAGGWDLLPIAKLLGNAVKWNILPNPIWPNGPATFDNIDYYVLNRATKHPNHAWAFMQWVCAEPAYQAFQMRTTLVEPCLLSLWDQWLTVAAQVVPILATKDIHYIADAARQGYAYPNRFFKYSAAQVANVIDSWGAQIWSGQLSPVLGLKQMADQINSIEATGNVVSQTSSTLQKLFPVAGASIASVQPGL